MRSKNKFNTRQQTTLTLRSAVDTKHSEETHVELVVGVENSALCNMGLRLQRFCCCCTLRTGTLVIGTAGWIFTFLELFCLVGPAVDKTESRSAFDDSGDEDLDKSLRNFERALDKANHNNLYYQIGYGVVTLIIAILLIVGVYKKDKRYMLPWLVLKCFEGVLTILGTILVFILACAVAELRLVFFIFTFILIIVTVIVWYTWLCVYSHYRELGDVPPQDGIPPVYYAPPPTYNEAKKSKFDMA